MTYLAAPYFINTGVRIRYAAMAGQDDPLTPVFAASGGAALASKTISGHVYDTNGTAVVGATVKLIRQLDDFVCQVATSGAGGVYSFTRRADDTKSYYTLAYSLAGGTTQVHGTSNRSLVPA